MTALPLIAPKPLSQFTAEEYYTYVSEMYALRQKRNAKPPSPAPGLTLSRNKKGGLTIRRSKVRAFEYVLRSEITALAKHYGTNQSDVWNAFKRKEYIIAESRMEAERIYSEIKEIPWGVM